MRRAICLLEVYEGRKWNCMFQRSQHCAGPGIFHIELNGLENRTGVYRAWLCEATGGNLRIVVIANYAAQLR